MPSTNVKIVFFVPESHAEIVRTAMGQAGAGKIGNYSFCSFSSKGIGRFHPDQGANPLIGSVGTIQEVNEERVEMICARDKLESVLNAMKAAHPYEEVGFDVYPLEDL